MRVSSEDGNNGLDQAVVGKEVRGKQGELARSCRVTL